MPCVCVCVCVYARLLYPIFVVVVYAGKCLAPRISNSHRIEGYLPLGFCVEANHVYMYSGSLCLFSKVSRPIWKPLQDFSRRMYTHEQKKKKKKVIYSHRVHECTVKP